MAVMMVSVSMDWSFRLRLVFMLHFLWVFAEQAMRCLSGK